jgi:hypothetical protein
MFIFNLNVVFTTDCLKMAQIRVRFSPGFPPESVSLKFFSTLCLK